MQLQSGRIECWQNTVNICNLMNNPPPKSMKFFYDRQFQMQKRYQKSNIAIYNKDAIDLSYNYNNPLVLNLSDDKLPGGYVDAGSGAQEESIFRRSNYFQTLDRSFYPIEPYAAVYSPNVAVIKSSESDGWSLYDKPKYVNFIACPAIKYPALINGSLSDIDIERLKYKIRLIIQVAYRYGHDCIIFGAMGCGAWHNPPTQVAAIFRQILRENDGIICDYIFAILKTKDDGKIRVNDNYDIFMQEFFQ